MSAANILQIYKDLPSYMCMVRWSCIGPTEFGVFFPVSNAVNDFSDAYEKLIDSRALDLSSAYGVFKALNTICSMDRTVFKEGTSTYWSNLETYYISLNAMLLDKMKGMSHDEAVRYVTSVTMEIEDEVLDDAGHMYSECLSYYALNNKISSNPFDPMPGYFDVASFSAKYGWTMSVVGGTYELKNGSDIVTITDTSNHAEYKCTVTVNGKVTKDVSCTYRDGSICIPVSYMSEFSSKVPVNIYGDSKPVSGGDDSSWIVATVVIGALVVASVGLFIYIRRP